MDKGNSIFIQNEIDANRFSAKIMLLTIIFVGLVYLLNVIGIFIVPMATMTLAMSAAVVLLLIPFFIIFVLKLKGRWIKYVIVAIAALMVAVLSTFLKYHVVLMYIYGIAIASLYFSRKLSWFSVISSITVISVSQILGYSVGGIIHNNVQSLNEVIIYGVVPRGIALLALSLIFTALASRTRAMLRNMKKDPMRLAELLI